MRGIPGREGLEPQLPLLVVKGYTNGWPRFEALFDDNRVTVKEMNDFLKDYGFVVTQAIPPIKKAEPKPQQEQMVDITEPHGTSSIEVHTLKGWRKVTFEPPIESNADGTYGDFGKAIMEWLGGQR